MGTAEAIRNGHSSPSLFPSPRVPARQDSWSPLRGPSQGFTLLDLGRAVLLQPDRLDGNEATGILGAEALEGVHASLLLTVEVALRRGPRKDMSRALVDHHVDLAMNLLLAENDGVF